jgi:hypothetical protein
MAGFTVPLTGERAVVRVTGGTGGGGETRLDTVWRADEDFVGLKCIEVTFNSVWTCVHCARKMV